MSLLLSSTLLAVTLSSCNNLHLEFSFEGSSQDYGTAILAASEWNQTCPNVWVQVTRGGDGIPMVVVPPNTLLAQNKAGVTRYSGKDVRDILVDGAYPHRVVFVHEIGHALGLDHKPQGVMRAEVDEGAYVTPEDCP